MTNKYEYEFEYQNKKLDLEAIRLLQGPYDQLRLGHPVLVHFLVHQAENFL